MGGYDLIQLNYRDSKPIYEQIKDGFRKLIITNSLSANEKLPSVRELASGLAINPNTIQKAYRDLESEGYTYTVAGKGIETGEHASAMALGEPGVLHGMRSYLLQDADGNVQLAHSISAGLDYPGVGPEHAYLKECGRARYVAIRDDEAMDALMELCRLEGIIPAIESAHAVAYAMKYARERKEAVGEKQAAKETMVICLSGRGDKDVNTIADYLAGKGYLN